MLLIVADSALNIHYLERVNGICYYHIHTAQQMTNFRSVKMAKQQNTSAENGLFVLQRRGTES